MIGILLENGVVDELRMAVVRSLSVGLMLTFHRAFDVTPDPLRALESIVTLGTRHRGGLSQSFHDSCRSELIQSRPASGLQLCLFLN